MAQRIPHSVLIDGGSHIVRMRFHLIYRIAHRHTNAGSTKHGARSLPPSPNAMVSLMSKPR